ncbi:unnamed protein product [Prorocentrum cordatum]|uniref:Uncharacterized protein n=1 Tax=Prorocentrum cordatum TaxID=2364126 RepID=A0ABN9VY07_9DINO|nr:unnamed protein product [Polarella glacialis]
MAAGWRARAERGPAGYATRRTEHGRSAIGERRGGRRWAQHSAPRSRGQSRGRRRGPPWPPWRGVSAPEATRPRGSRDDDDDDDDDGDGDDDDDDDGGDGDDDDDDDGDGDDDNRRQGAGPSSGARWAQAPAKARRDPAVQSRCYQSASVVGHPLGGPSLMRCAYSERPRR